MGFNLQWLAIKDNDIKHSLKDISLKPTNLFEEFSDSADFCLTKINDWNLIVDNTIKYYDVLDEREFEDNPVVQTRETIYKQFSEEKIANLSKNCIVIVCDVSDYLMSSKIASWEDGEKIWEVSHDSQVSPDHLKIEGTPPKELNKIIEELRNQQAQDTDGDVDYIYEVPIELGSTLIGYRHDEDISDDERSTPPWQVLEIDYKCSQGFWQKAKILLNNLIKS